MALYRIAPIANIGDTFDGLAGSGGKLVKGVDGDEKISLDEDNSRCSYNQEGAGLNITNFPPEPISFGTRLRDLMLLMKRELNL
jgi:hypothetical protein